MSWEDQGRQEHGRFGNGTSGVEVAGSSRVVGAGEVDETVVRGASAFLSGAERQGFERFLAGGGARLLVDAMPVWAGASGLDEGAFRGLVVGGRAGAGVARALQATGAAVREARDAEGLRVASASLAAVVREGGAEWRYQLRSARDQAVHVAAMGAVSPGPAAGVFVAGSGAVGAGGRVGAAALSRFGPWGRIAGGVLLAGTLLYEYLHGAGDGAGGASVAPMRPPADAEDEGEGRPPRVNKPPPKALEEGDGDTPSSLKGMSKLSDGEADEMARKGFHPHDTKDGQGDSKVDLYKDKKGNIYIGNKDGSGSASSTGKNIRNLK